MRIVYLDFDNINNPLLAAGQARATFNVGRELVKRGHKVTVICSRYPGSKDFSKDGINYTHVGLGTSNIKLNNFAYFFAIPFAVRRLNSSNTDIIIECFTAPISTLFSPLFTRVPVVVLPSMFNAQEFSKKYHLPLHWIEKMGTRLYKYMLPYSEVDSKKMRQMNPQIIYQITSQGVGDSFFKIKQKKPKFILFFARLDIYQKGIDLLLESYSKVKNTIKYPLVIAGHGPDKSKVEDLVRLHQLENKVTLIGYIDGLKKEQIFSEALYATFPSRHDEMNLGCLEVLAAGLPLVAFDLNESKWLTNTVSWKAKPYDTSSFAKLLLKATIESEYSKRRLASRLFAKKFQWSAVAKKFENFFIKVLKNEAKR